MYVTPIQKNTSILRPRARLIRTIGEELISNDIVAIIELVKNSYDANAKIIEIKFQGVVSEVKDGKKIKKTILKEGASIIISDDGVGMSLATVQGAWMEPATVNKKNSKKSVGDKRRYTGEKGIGRFASAKLAAKLKMITRPKDDNEIVVGFNWAEFSDDKYLDQVQCDWEVREPIEIKDQGTILKLEDISSDWDEEKLRELRIALSRLINPVAPVIDFLMDIRLPDELENLSGLVAAPDSLNKPDYYIKGDVDKNGKPHLKYFSKKVGQEEFIAVEESDFSLREPVRKSMVGAFSFEFRIWNRDSDSIKKLSSETNSRTKDIKRDLDDLAGISIYRDNFRVLPYGSKDDDWLRLDIRRVNNPTLRLSNNQVVGYVSVSLDENPELKDQSNREGIVESQAFTDLKELIINILNQVERKRYIERPRESDEQSQQGVFDNFSIGTIVELIKSKLPDDKELNDAIIKAEVAIQSGVKKVKDVISRYRRLSTLGLLIDMILHDGNNCLANIDSEIHLLSRVVNKVDYDTNIIEEHIKNINEGRKSMAQLFKRLEPFGGRKRGSPKNIVIEEAIANVFSIYKSQLNNLKIQTELPTSRNELKIDDAELQMIFVNLISNSMHWLETESTDRKIQVVVETLNDELMIIFSDNGPGIKEENQKFIFDPYFSTKTGGIGLGLTNVGELVTENNGDLALIDNGPLDGATFRMIFKR